MSTEQGDDEPKVDGDAPTAPAPVAPADATDAPTGDAPTGDAPPEAAPDADSERDPWPFDFDSEGGSPELSFSGDGDLTLDAFERAVSRAVHDKLGAAQADADAPGAKGPPKGADELVASVLGALTGKDARAALDEVRSQLAAGKPKASERGADVIDLQAVREARKRQPPSDFSLTIGDALKDTFNRYLAQVAQQSGRAEFTIDAAFLKQHGPTLLGNLFQGLAQSLLPQMAPPKGRPPVVPAPDAPTPDTGDAAVEDGPEGATVEPDDASAASDAGASPPHGPDPPRDASAPSVSIKVDLGSILANLFKRRPPSQ